MPPLFFVPSNAPALRAPHFAGRAFVSLFCSLVSGGVGFVSLWCRRSQNGFCAWANEELFDTFPDFWRSGVDSVSYVNPFTGNFTSFERALRCQFNFRRSDVPTSGFLFSFST